MRLDMRTKRAILKAEVLGYQRSRKGEKNWSLNEFIGISVYNLHKASWLLLSSGWRAVGGREGKRVFLLVRLGRKREGCGQYVMRKLKIAEMVLVPIRYPCGKRMVLVRELLGKLERSAGSRGQV